MSFKHNFWRRIAKYIVNIRHGKVSAQEDEIQLMHDLVQKYSSFDDLKPPSVNHDSTVDQITAPSNHNPFNANEVIVSFTSPILPNTI